VTDASRVVVQVKDVIDPALTGHEGCTYESPPQSRDEALTLVRVVLGYSTELRNESGRWSCPVAGGRRTVTVEQAN
jgi:hypothetical protein